MPMVIKSLVEFCEIRNKKENKSAGHSPVCTETEVEMGGACSQIR